MANPEGTDSDPQDVFDALDRAEEYLEQLKQDEGYSAPVQESLDIYPQDIRDLIEGE